MERIDIRCKISTMLSDRAQRRLKRPGRPARKTAGAFNRAKRAPAAIENLPELPLVAD
jgi:hypothetical protein